MASKEGGTGRGGLSGYVPQHRHLTTVASLAILLLAVCAQAQSDDKTLRGRLPEVTVRTVADESLRGELSSLSLSDGAVIRLDSKRERRVAITDLVRIAMPISPAGKTLRDWTYHLVGGDVLYGRAVGRDEEAVIVETTDLGRLSVPLEYLVRFLAPVADTPAQREATGWFQRDEELREDRVLLANGDVVHGFITRMDQDGVAIESAMGETRIPKRLVVAGRFAPASPPKLDTPCIILSLRNSGRITVTDLNWSGRTGEVRTRFGQHIRLEVERVVRLEVLGGRWEWLSGHQPISEQHTPMLSLPWSATTNRNVRGGPIIVAGEPFEHGIGVHSRSSLTFDLKGAYRDFVTHFGIDDDSGPQADVSVVIRVDGQLRFQQAGIRRGRLHGPVRLDVAGANHIELIVDFGENGDLQDRLDWVEPALVR